MMVGQSYAKMHRQLNFNCYQRRLIASMDKLYSDLKEIIEREGEKISYTLLDELNGCVAGCRCGVTVCRRTEFGKGDVHEDQEGFFVLSGRGMTKVGDIEFAVHEGVAFIVPAGVSHTLCSVSAEEPLKVLWFHSAV